MLVIWLILTCSYQEKNVYATTPLPTANVFRVWRSRKISATTPPPPHWIWSASETTENFCYYPPPHWIWPASEITENLPGDIGRVAPPNKNPGYAVEHRGGPCENNDEEMGLSRRRPVGVLRMREATDDGPPPLLPSTRRDLYGWRPSQSDRAGKGMRPQVGDNCVKDMKEEEDQIMILINAKY